MTTRYISDLHFGHQGMANMRGFLDVEQMNSLIIEQWNRIVTNKKDIVFILGDITMEKKAGYELLDKLNGVKHVILGNHDRRQDVKELLKYVDTVCGMMGDKKNGVIFTHCPIHPSELDYRFKYNVHGHVHENTLSDPRYINVSAEVINYQPKTLEELLKNKI